MNNTLPVFKRSTALRLCGLLSIALSSLSPAFTAEGAGGPQSRPNFLIIMADDCTYNDLALYGGQNAKTPNIDRLATQGLTFNLAYLSEAMCQPCRAELYSGQYPMRNGCAWNHSASRPMVTSMPQHLKALGYRVGIAGKVHVKPQKAFPFVNVGGFDPNCVRNPTRKHDLKSVGEFISRAGDQPFCLVVALVEPHVPWVMGDASKYPAKKIKLPPNIADTPRTREDYGKYLAEITYMDGQVGEVLGALDSGRARRMRRWSSLPRNRARSFPAASGPIGTPACIRRSSPAGPERQPPGKGPMRWCSTPTSCRRCWRLREVLRESTITTAAASLVFWRARPGSTEPMSTAFTTISLRGRLIRFAR